MDNFAFKPITIKIGDLVVGTPTNDIWILNPTNTILSLEYTVKQVKVKKNSFDLLALVSSVEMLKKSDRDKNEISSTKNEVLSKE